jgi:hypothetical protein
MEDYASTDIRKAMTRITQLLNSSDASSNHSLSEIELALTPPPTGHHHPSFSGSKNFDSCEEDVTSLEVLHKELTRTMSAKQFQSTTLSRMVRSEAKTKGKIEKMRLIKEAKDLQEVQAVPKISENSKKMVTTQGDIYERTQRLAEERKKELEEKKAKALQAKTESENAELTFKPKTNSVKGEAKRDAEEVNKALYAWQKEKETKVKAKQDLKIKSEIEAATFKPELTQRTNKLASRRNKVKTRVDKRLYAGVKLHLDVLKQSETKYGPKFKPDLSSTKGHRMKKTLNKDVFNRLYNSSADLAEMLRTYNSQPTLVSNKSLTSRAYRPTGEVTSTGSLLRNVKPGAKPLAARPQTDRRVTKAKKGGDLGSYKAAELAYSSSEVMRTLYNAHSQSSSQDEADDQVDELPLEESEDNSDYVDEGGVGSLLASLSSLSR